MSTCSYTVDDRGVALMIINNPPMNALSTPVIKDIRAAVEKALADDAVRVVVFTGEGRAFIAGADISEFTGLNTQKEGSDWLKPGQELLNLIENADKPFIAAINGFALGGGCELALACTIRIAAEKAKIGLPEITLGLIPGYGGTQRLPRVVGRGKALEMILSGLPVNAQEALRIGLVSKVVPDGELMKEAEKMAELLCKRAPIAMRLAMEAVGDGIEMSIDDALSYEANMLAILFETEDKKEGVRAFIEKRPPVFKGE